MRWQRAPVLSFFVLLLHHFVFAESSFAAGKRLDISKGLPLIKANFTRISENSYAYYAVNDLRNGNMGFHYIRILLMTTRPYHRFHCRFRNGGIVRADIYEFSENHLTFFGVYYANCKVPLGEKYFGSVQMLEEHITPPVQVPITYKIEDEHRKIDYKLDYAICVPVLFGNKYIPKRIIEFMELNRLLGAKRVTIYTDLSRSDLSFDMWRTLNHYADIGFLQVIDFRLPLDSDNIWYHGQLAVVADCLMQHTGVAEFVGFHDLDEFIVPMQKRYVVDELRESLAGSIGSLRISTQYTSSYNMDKAPLITLDAFRHGELDPTYTKCVLRPEMVFEQGIHHTSRVIQNYYHSPGADDKKLRVFHYKSRYGGHSYNIQIAQIYGSQLEQNFNYVTKYLGV